MAKANELARNSVNLYLRLSDAKESMKVRLFNAEFCHLIGNHQCEDCKDYPHVRHNLKVGIQQTEDLMDEILEAFRSSLERIWTGQ